MKVQIKDIQPAFNNAHKALWALKKPDRPLLGSKSTEIQGRWWMEEHDVLLYGDSLFSWTYAEFPSEEALSWFMLKWS